MSWAPTLLIATALVAGCATSTTLVERAATLQPGVSTTNDAIAKLGSPNSRSAAGNGAVLLQWMESKSLYVSASAAHVAILFDSNGRMIRVAHSFKSDP